MSGMPVRTTETVLSRRSRLVSFTALVVALLAIGTPGHAQASATASSSGDPHDYPRTYHLYGSGPVDELARYDFVVGWSWFDIAGLSARNPNGIFLLNPAWNGPSGREGVFVTAPGGAAAWPGASDRLAGGANLGTIRALDPGLDLLHNADGSIASVSPGYTRIEGWNLADPRGAGTANLVAKVFAYSAKNDGLYSRGWDGVHSDNWIYPAIGSNWFYGPNLDTDRNGKADDMATLRRNWANGLALLGNNLRAYLPGKIVGGNGNWYRPQDYTGSDPDGWLKASNYTLVENMENYAYNTPDSFLAQTRRWLDYPDPLGQPRYMAVYQEALDASGKRLAGSSNPNDPSIMLRPDVMKSMRWGLTLSLMTDVYYEITLDGNHSTRWWYDEYDGGVGVRKRGYLGKPLGGPAVLSSSIYRRDYQNGIVLNNSSNSSQTISLGGSFRKLQGTQNPSLNNGATVTSVTVPAHDGIILLRTSAAPAPAPVQPAAAPAPAATPPAGTNLAAGKPASASSTRGSDYTAAKAVDGNPNTRWSAAWRNGEWWQVDLGTTTQVATVSIDWEDAYASHYLIQTSTDGSTYTTAADITNTGPGPKTTTFTARPTRYLRILQLTRGTNAGTSFYEVQVYGPAGSTSASPPPSAPQPAPAPAPSAPPAPAPPSSPSPPSPGPAGTNLAAGKPASASSTRGSDYTAAKAVDGNPNTRWSAAWRNGEWWQVDLGTTTQVATVSIDWEDAYASHYLIQTSTDGSTYTTAADITNTGPGPKTTTFTARPTRYLRILQLTRGTNAGTSFYEVQVYGS
jgi:hypothetical protein